MKFSAKNIVAFVAILSSLVLSGCGATLQGRFVDSAVQGLWYETETQEGYTDVNGTFNFLEGESVSFYLGQTLLGTVEAKDLVTPLDMLTDEDHPDKLQNILRVLQSLDADSDSSNGIEITSEADEYLDQFTIPFNNPATIFQASSVVTDIVDAVTNGSDLISALDSFVHFRETLLAERRDTTGEIVLNLLNTTWDAEVTSTICDESETASLVYNFNIVGATTLGHHRLVETEDEFGNITCKPAGYGFLFKTYETDELFACANECTEEDLNRVIVSEDDLGDVVTTMTYNAENDSMTINVSYFDGEETQTTSTVLTKRS
ncbi:MAG: hypothetical protein MI867_15080 [Pseudomonadales bacterium]|nr:hypothetical protein [Pseudomonadales bacterium]